jgi:hypothetical protein
MVAGTRSDGGQIYWNAVCNFTERRMDDFGNMRFDNLKKRALTKISELQKLIEQDVILELVPTTVCSDGFASRSTVENFVFFAHLKYTGELISILT